MPITPEKFRWASVTETDTLTGLPNKTEIPSEYKNSGAKSNQPIPRQWINNQFNEQYNALVDLQSQIDAITGGSSLPTIELIFPIGTLWYTDNASIDPAVQFGVGTWVKVATGKFVVGVDTGDTDFDTAGKTDDVSGNGGKTHDHAVGSLSVDGHSLTASEVPDHTHTVGTQNLAYDSGASNATILNGNETSTTNNDTAPSTHTHGLSGVSASGDSLPPYYATIIWKRTA